MKKIGIITIIDYMNYGNRLQNYATQEVIKLLGYDVETIVNYPQDINSYENIFDKIKRTNKKSSIKFFAHILKRIRFKFFKTKREMEIQRLNQKKSNNFIEFTKMNIKETSYTITPNTIPSNFGEKYDYFVVGSDQVWNPNFRNGSPIDFLTFAPTEKRVSFSASFGVSEIENHYVDSYKKWLTGMSHISVREQSGANLINQLIGKDSQVLLDPTMLLSKEEWMKICKPLRVERKEYLLTYFLGEVSDEKSHWINEAAEKNGLTIVNIADINCIEYYCVDPSQFIYLISNCSMFFTDSFHGTVFSILFEKPFVVFERESKTPSMGSRIANILSKFELEDRRWDKIKRNDDLMNINFSHVPDILRKEKAKAYDYLKNALDIKDAN